MVFQWQAWVLRESATHHRAVLHLRPPTSLTVFQGLDTGETATVVIDFSVTDGQLERCWQSNLHGDWPDDAPVGNNDAALSTN